jgi:hypothetical protein
MQVNAAAVEKAVKNRLPAFRPPKARCYAPHRFEAAPPLLPGRGRSFSFPTVSTRVERCCG